MLACYPMIRVFSLNSVKLFVKDKNEAENGPFKKAFYSEQISSLVSRPKQLKYFLCVDSISCQLFCTTFATIQSCSSKSVLLVSGCGSVG